jgi:hypothetical protein
MMTLTNGQIIEHARQEGVSYADFMQRIRARITEAATLDLGEQEQALHDYTVLNLKRSERIERTYVMGAEMSETLAGLDCNQLWMVITEGWCGDSAQILPYISAAAAVNPRIEFRILERDDHLDIMDHYLTNDTRSIPKLVVFDRDANELAAWGPRPSKAAELILELKGQNLPRPEMYEKLHLWYGRDRGKEIEKELRDVVITAGCTATTIPEIE